ncbi:amidohydrolase family protein [Paenibacillus eucommiae]|uniref:TIM-barrel fold metal-dependent hydrolase n=1 Tax=Paenibacillus eucommiae TaxID=1355755 RepID=A0ABS4ITX9_9BACL|nr:amidohydrolase family protein [Paenibacillus eucommiae]MBP1991041.1 putative TIM-barrel fold metal-dependent hydrolase [Paenibacillus eucommiae]
MKIIDCNCAIGYRTVNYEVINHEHLMVVEKVKQARDAEELLKELDFCGIDSAVVYHNTMIDVFPNHGNDLIIGEVNKAPERLISTWTILPPITESEYAPEQLFHRMKENNVKLLRAYPEQNRYFLNAVVMGELLEEITKAGIPLYLSPSLGWEMIYNVLKEYPDLTVIINNYGLWSHDRFLFPLFRAYKNVYIESGDMQTSGEIKDICNRFGSERILFGSDFPSNCIGGPLATLLGSGITQEHMDNIAHLNIERILQGVQI